MYVSRGLTSTFLYANSWVGLLASQVGTQSGTGAARFLHHGKAEGLGRSTHPHWDHQPVDAGFASIII